jgi:hypothetical protein
MPSAHQPLWAGFARDPNIVPVRFVPGIGDSPA